MSLDDVYKFGAITYYKVIYIERALDTWRQTFNNGVYFDSEKGNWEYAALWDTHVLGKNITGKDKPPKRAQKH